MISWQMKRNRIICLTYSLLSGLLSSTTAQINFTREVDSCLYVGDSLVWVAQYLGGSTVDSVNWYFHKQAVGDIVVLISTCTVFGSPDGGYPNMTYTCDSSTNTYTATISNLNGAEEGDWGVSFTFDDFTSTSTVKESLSLCIKCPIENVTDGSLNITYSAVREGEVAGLTCRKGYVSIGKSEFTCMSNGSWSPPLQGCTGTTTATTITKTTPTTTPRATSTSKSMTSISLTPITTPTSLTSTVRTSAADTYSTTRTTSTNFSSAIATESASMTVASTIKTATILTSKSDKDLITMIIVVSVIGGILVLAIFVIIFFWVHRKNRYHKDRFPSSDNAKKGRHHKRHTGDKPSTFQMENAVENYYFYTGKINPVYDGTVVTSYIYPNQETFYNPEYTEQRPHSSYWNDHN